MPSLAAGRRTVFASAWARKSSNFPVETPFTGKRRTSSASSLRLHVCRPGSRVRCFAGCRAERIRHSVDKTARKGSVGGGGQGGWRVSSPVRRRGADLDMPAGILSDIFGMGHRSQRRGGGVGSGGGHCLNLSPRIEVSACSPAFHHEGTERGTFRVPQGRVDRMEHLRVCPVRSIKCIRFAFLCAASKLQ